MQKPFQKIANILIVEYKKVKGKPTPSLLEKHGLTHLLERFYTSLEDEMKKLFQKNNREIPSSKEWHKEILKQSKKMSILSDEIFELMKSLLKFRHWSRFGYLEEIEWEKLSENLEKVNELSKKFEKDVENFNKKLQN